MCLSGRTCGCLPHRVTIKSKTENPPSAAPERGEILSWAQPQRCLTRSTDTVSSERIYCGQWWDLGTPVLPMGTAPAKTPGRGLPAGGPCLRGAPGAFSWPKQSPNLSGTSASRPVLPGEGGSSITGRAGPGRALPAQLAAPSDRARARARAASASCSNSSRNRSCDTE